MDFTRKKYKSLLSAIQEAGYSFQTYSEFLENPLDKVVILRHDVDLKPKNSLALAEIQHASGVKGVYYFRAVKASWDESIILKIKDLGHEIGYHYENLSVSKGRLDLAYEDFICNLVELRKLAPVHTICMHGSPLSRYDNKNLWKQYNYKSLGIKGEPYFDTDFSKVYYLTDTGRTWDNKGISVRDKVESSFNVKFSNSNQLIESFQKEQMPPLIMFTFHPQRWTDNPIEWVFELILQKVKNNIKRWLIRRRV